LEGCGVDIKKTKYVGNRQFESECITCGAGITWKVGDSLFIEVDSDGQKGLVCSKCYATHTREEQALAVGAK
jgi:hypothetical protein